jgi:hypothetical protein
VARWYLQGKKAMIQEGRRSELASEGAENDSIDSDPLHTTYGAFARASDTANSSSCRVINYVHSA